MKIIHGAEELRQLLSYDPETGLLIWRHREGAFSGWNTRFAGRRAFTYLNSRGYFQGTVGGRVYTAHRVIWTMCNGDLEHWHIDHINGNQTDNRLVNLRLCTPEQNARNRGITRSNRSGAVGVALCNGKFRAQIKARGKQMHLGTFDNFEAAKLARREAEARLGFFENHGARPASFVKAALNLTSENPS